MARLEAVPARAVRRRTRQGGVANGDAPQWRRGAKTEFREVSRGSHRYVKLPAKRLFLATRLRRSGGWRRTLAASHPHAIGGDDDVGPVAAGVDEVQLAASDQRLPEGCLEHWVIGPGAIMNS